MARRRRGIGAVAELEERSRSVLDELRGRAESGSPAIDRALAIDESLSNGTSDADVMWFVGRLSGRQRQYGIELVNYGGDQRKAAEAAGYSPNTPIESIESGDVMQAYLKSIAHTLAVSSSINGAIVLTRLDRIALAAEGAGQLGIAVQANKAIGDAFGLFENKGSQTRTNAEGVVITIAGPRDPEYDANKEISDEYRRVLEENGRDDIVKALLVENPVGEEDD